MAMVTMYLVGISRVTTNSDAVYRGNGKVTLPHVQYSWTVVCMVPMFNTLLLDMILPHLHNNTTPQSLHDRRD